MENQLPLSKETLKFLSHLSLAAGLFSIAVSVISWFSASGRDRERSEHLGIFFGLWVPSFFVLSHRLARAADEGDWEAETQKGGLEKIAGDFLEEVGGLTNGTTLGRQVRL